MIKREHVDILPSEIEVWPDQNGLRNVEGDEVELNQENFAKLCKKVTEIQMNREKTLDEVEQKLDDLDQKLHELETSDHVVRDMKQDLQKTARIISTLRVEAADLKKLKNNNT